MADQSDQNTPGEPAGSASAEKDPSDWVTGDEPMTGPQRSYLHTLAQQAHEDVDDQGLTKAEASQKIDERRTEAGLS